MTLPFTKEVAQILYDEVARLQDEGDRIFEETGDGTAAQNCRLAASMSDIFGRSSAAVVIR